MLQPLRRAVRDRVRRPAGHRGRGRRRASHVLCRRPRAARRLRRRRDVHLGPGPGADPLAQPARGWDLRVRRARAPASASTSLTTGTAIHGLVRWAAWTVAEREPDRVVVRHDLHPQPGYPFSLAIRIEYVLSADGLRVSTTATNVGGDPCPFGAGAHPYLFPARPWSTPRSCISPRRACSRSTRTECPPAPSRSRGRSSTSCSRGRSAPRSSTTASPICTGRRRPRAGHGREHRGRRRRRDALGRRGLPLPHAVHGDDRPDVNRRSMAIEPMTCPPQAFRSGKASSASSRAIRSGAPGVSRCGPSRRG